MDQRMLQQAAQIPAAVVAELVALMVQVDQTAEMVVLGS
jgi:hypothetical protein